MKAAWGIGSLLSLAVVLGVAAPSPASATEYDLTFDSNLESKDLATILTSGSTVSLDGILAPGSVLNRLDFTWNSSSPFSLSAAWRVGAAAATTPRLVGVNIDLFNSANALVGSDVFIGVGSEIASSSMQIANLATGNYTLILTGTALRDGLFGIDLVAGPTLPATPTVEIIAPDPGDFLYDTLTGEKSVGNPFAAGNLLSIDGAIDEIGALLHQTELMVTNGTVSAGISWLVNSNAPGDTGPRLVGFNVDLFDQFNALAASDVFGGVVDGVASSQFVATGLAPGRYTMVTTGTSVRGAQYRIDLGNSATPPPVPQFGAVPEPSTWVYMLFGFAAVGGALRRDPVRRPVVSA